MNFLRFTLTIIALSLVSLCSAQVVKGNGNLKTITHETSEFTELIVQGSFSLFLIQGEKEGVKIECDENIQGFFQINPGENTLQINMLADVRKFVKLNVYVSFKQLNQLTLLNNISFKTNEVLHFEELDLFVSGESRVEGDIYAQTLNLQVVDAAFAFVSGYSEYLNILAHDETEVNAFAMQSDYCKVKSTGLSETMVDVQKELDLMVTGASNVYYSGNPKISNRTFSSSGFIIKRKNPNAGR